jgi:hypothetical protein
MKVLSKTFAITYTGLSMIFFSSFFSHVNPVTGFNPMLQHYSPPSVFQTLPVKNFIPFHDLSHYENINHFSDKGNHISEEVGKNIVLSVSAGLPKFDSVGHKILSANHDFISNILHNEFLSHAIKKDIILASIKLAQMGDDMGSHILQYYYNLVEYCL